MHTHNTHTYTHTHTCTHAHTHTYTNTHICFFYKNLLVFAIPYLHMQLSLQLPVSLWRGKKGQMWRGKNWLHWFESNSWKTGVLSITRGASLGL